MKKLALLFGFLALTSQLPFCPYRALPGDVASSLEYGRKWTGMFLQAYGIADAEPVNSSQNESTDTPVVVAAANPVSLPAEPVPADEPCPYEDAEAALPAIDAEFPEFDIEFPVIVESVEVSGVEPVALSIQMDPKGKLSREEFQLEVQKAMKEARKAIQRDSKLQETIKASRKSKARYEKLRLITLARSV